MADGGLVDTTHGTLGAPAPPPAPSPALPAPPAHLRALLHHSRMKIEYTGDWSPIYWPPLHHYAAMFPENPTTQQRQAGLAFLQVHFPAGLPCSRCANHFRHHARNAWAATRSRADLFAWTVAIHNQVNRDRGMPEITVEEAAAIFTRPDQLSNSIRATSKCLLEAAAEGITNPNCVSALQAVEGGSSSSARVITVACVVVVAVMLLVVGAVSLHRMWPAMNGGGAEAAAAAPPHLPSNQASPGFRTRRPSARSWVPEPV